MQQENRQKIGILLILLGLIIIILIVYFFFFRRGTTNQEVVNNPIENVSPQEETITEGTTTPNDIPRNYQQYDITKEEPHSFNEADLAARAKSWAERFGSYNNQSDYGNFTDLKIYMTGSFADWVDGHVEELRTSKVKAGSYYGIVTNAFSSEVTSYNDKAGKAEVLVSTERVESDDSGDKEPYYQTIKFSLVKENGEWLIDAAYWEKK